MGRHDGASAWRVGEEGGEWGTVELCGGADLGYMSRSSERLPRVDLLEDHRAEVQRPILGKKKKQIKKQLEHRVGEVYAGRRRSKELRRGAEKKQQGGKQLNR